MTPNYPGVARDDQISTFQSVRMRGHICHIVRVRISSVADPFSTASLRANLLQVGGTCIGFLRTRYGLREPHGG
jgi:hypothetical protein